MTAPLPVTNFVAFDQKNNKVFVLCNEKKIERIKKENLVIKMEQKRRHTTIHKNGGNGKRKKKCVL